jgi:hypothetical protein
MEIDPEKTYANIIKTSKGYCIDPLTSNFEEYKWLKGTYFKTSFDALDKIKELGLELAVFVAN